MPAINAKTRQGYWKSMDIIGHGSASDQFYLKCLINCDNWLNFSKSIGSFFCGLAQSAKVWLHIIMMQENYDCFFRILWRQFYWCKWTFVFTILPKLPPCKCILHLHHLSVHWHYHRAEFSQLWYRSEKLLYWQLSWLSRDRWWPIRWRISPWQTLWQCHPCSHTVQPESTVAEVSKTFW